jgi:MFS family permease
MARTEPDDSNRPSLTRALAALQYRDFRYYFLASVVAGFGASLQGIANAWQIFLITGSPLALGATGLFRAIPIILFSLIGGVIADRVDRRKIIMFTQFSSGLFAILLGVLSVTGLIQVWHIYVLTFISAAVNSASLPARDAITANLVPRQHLMQAIGLNQSVLQISRIAGPSIAGLLIATISLPLTYLLNGLAHVVTFAMISRIYLGPLPARSRGNALQSILEGLRFVRTKPIILTLLSIDFVMNLLGSFQAVLPIVASRLGTDARGFGLLSSAPGLGALLGTMFIVSFGDLRYKGFVMIGAVLSYCLWVVGLGGATLIGGGGLQGSGAEAFSPWFLAAILCTFMAGASDAIFSNPRNTLFQLMTPDELRGRVSSFRTTITTSGPSLGQATIGAAASILTVPIALVAGGTICALYTLASFARWRDLRDRNLGAMEREPIQQRVETS